MAYRIEWTEMFADNLAELIENFKQYKSKKKAKEILDTVFDKTDLLKNNPKMGRPSKTQNVRSISLNPDYRMYYTITSEEIQMLTIFFMRTDPDKNPFE